MTELDRQQPPRTVVVQGNGNWRAVHRRAFSAQYEFGIFVVRDLYTIGPDRAEKRRAIEDKIDLASAYMDGLENGLFRTLHTMHCLSQGPEVTNYLYSFELEIEQTPDGIRKSRAALRGDDRVQQRRATVQGPWRLSRTKAEADLDRIKRAWLANANGIEAARAAAAALHGEMPLAQPPARSARSGQQQRHTRGSCGVYICFHLLFRSKVT